MYVLVRVTVLAQKEKLLNLVIQLGVMGIYDPFKFSHSQLPNKTLLVSFSWLNCPLTKHATSTVPAHKQVFSCAFYN